MIQAVQTAQLLIKRQEPRLYHLRRPTYEITDPFSQSYEPYTECNCVGLYPLEGSETLQTALSRSDCKAIQRTVSNMKAVIDRQDEWNGHGMLSSKQLEEAVAELVLSNSDVQSLPSTCCGDRLSLSNITAPDRRPNPDCDSDASLLNSLYPTFERMKLFADAKHFLAVAGGVSTCDEGLSRAVADMINDELIADYRESLNGKTITLIRRVGVAAAVFFRLCNLAGVVSDWHFEATVADVIHFRVLGYYRNHAQSRMPGGFYGSRMTDRTKHRHIDLGLVVEVVIASLATGEQITESEYATLANVVTLINDLFDLRSDTARNNRENTVLCGVRGNACCYLQSQVSDCLEQACQLIPIKKLLAICIMAWCNWTLMASHHKTYELAHGLEQVRGFPPCAYEGLDMRYQQLLEALVPFGTLGMDGPSIEMKRKELDLLYSANRRSARTHLAWLADTTRVLLQPGLSRKLVDVVHYEWTGAVGDLHYCP